MRFAELSRSKRPLSPMAFGIGLLALACSGGTETGNPSFTGELSYTGYSSEPLRVAVGSAPTGSSEIVVNNAWLDLDAVAFSVSGGCSQAGSDFRVPALGIGDHAAGRHNATAFLAEPGTFCSAALPFALAGATAPAGTPAELLGRSLLLQGTLPDLTPFSISSTAAPDILLDGSGGFALDAGAPNLLIAFDFARWLDGVDPAQAERVNGTVLIDETNNSDILQTVQTNLATGVSLYRDADGDGKIDTGSTPIALGR